MKFTLPAELPTIVTELTALREEAAAEINTIQTAFADNGDLSVDDVTRLEYLLDAVDQLNSAVEHQTKVSAVVKRASAATATGEDEPEVEVDTEVVETEEVEAEVEPVDPRPAELIPDPERELVPAVAKAPVKFKGKGPRTVPADIEETSPIEPAWIVSHGAPGFDSSKVGAKVGFKEVGEALDSVRKGHGVGRLSGMGDGPKIRQSVVRMSRELPAVENDHDLVEQILRATDERKLPGGSLTAAGGWCAPSEQIYTFCDVPNATDLFSLPEIAIRRGGLRWPVEPDLTSIFENFEFFFTEPELEAVDSGDGTPTAIKHCVEIPCPDEFEEIRLNTVGYCVEAGILQRQGWPESIEWFLRSLTQEHLRAMSRRKILDVYNGSGTPKVFAAHLQVGGTSGILNALALYATNLRLNKGLGRTATIEGVAPSWFFEALRADMAMMEGIDTKSVSDAQISGWLSARNLAFQFVGDWQTRSMGLPGHLDTLAWPASVDVILYPAGTWFSSLSNIIEVGVLYPKEQLQINRYTEFFTEDAIAVGKRCNVSVNLTLPLCVTGGYGAPVEITCNDLESV